MTALCALGGGPTAAPPYNGRDNQLQIRIPRLEGDSARTVVDGVLDEPAWRRAAVLTGFSQFAPVDGIPSADSTEVLLWYSPNALHVGIRAYEKHGAVHATLADRDKITADDNVQLLLGTFHDHRQAYVFAVNPFGVQMDGTIVETGRPNTGGGFSATISGRAAPDLNQDFVFISKGRLTEYGYEVELRIPFKSLKYQSTDIQSWDINVVRQVQHSGFEDSWAPAKRSGASFLAQSGTLGGLTGFDRGLVLDLNPVMTRKAAGAPSPNGWAYGHPAPQFGLTGRWGLSNNFTLTGTARPDFAEVESDAGQIILDPRRAIRFPEKRPFFLDGLEQFNVPNSLIYTRRIAQPDAALKLTGKVAGTTIGVMSASDDQSLSPTGRDATRYNIVRAQRDIGGESRLGFAYTDRVVGQDYNRVADLDGRMVFGKIYTNQFQYARSFDRTSGAATSAPLWEDIFARNGKQFGLRYTLTGISDNFRASSGFISRGGIVHGAVDHRVTWFAPRGNFLEALTEDVVYDDIWEYSHFGHGDAQDKKLHVSTTAGLRGGWAVLGAVYWESFGWDKQLYGNYRIERTVGATVDTIPFVGVGRIPNRDYVATVTTPQWSRFSASATYIGGQDENFFEWAQADIHYLSLTTNFRPTDQLRVTGSLAFQDYWRRSDHSLAGKTAIPRVKAEYQFTRAVFFRAVGEYDLSEHNDLRDETRTFLPLIIGGKKALATRSAQLHGDWLFSYQPNPGTVLFLGYGSEADGNPNPKDRFAYQPLIRASDYFFVKLSYLFRM
ncbi:MAG: DUF5916 domain-containing protein [bacterium]